MEARTFREAYGVLQEQAETLREKIEPNIDHLLSIVTESVRAYKVCKKRIDAGEKALQKALTDVGGGAPPSDGISDGLEPAPRRAQAKPAAKNAGPDFDEIDDDVPF